MGWFSGLVVFLITWWTVLFMVLPWGSRPPETPEPGMATSAPEKPRIKLKFLVTTALTCVIWLVIYTLVEIEIISFREMAAGME